MVPWIFSAPWSSRLRPQSVNVPSVSKATGFIASTEPRSLMPGTSSWKTHFLGSICLLVAHCRKWSLLVSSLSTRMEVSGTEHEALPSSVVSSTASEHPTAELTAVMRSPTAASKTAVNVLLPASGSTANFVSAEARAASTPSSKRAAVRGCIDKSPSGCMPEDDRVLLRLALVVVHRHHAAELECGEDQRSGHEGAREHQAGHNLECHDHRRALLRLRWSSRHVGFGLRVSGPCESDRVPIGAGVRHALHAPGEVAVQATACPGVEHVRKILCHAHEDVAACHERRARPSVRQTSSFA